MKKRHNILFMKYSHSDVSQKGMHQVLNKIGSNKGIKLEGVSTNASEFNDVITLSHLRIQIM